MVLGQLRKNEIYINQKWIEMADRLVEIAFIIIINFCVIGMTWLRLFNHFSKKILFLLSFIECFIITLLYFI
jgi:hypothetical protein